MQIYPNESYSKDFLLGKNLLSKSMVKGKDCGYCSISIGIIFCIITARQVIIAAELLKNANNLIKHKLHPTSIISGYRLACR